MNTQNLKFSGRLPPVEVIFGLYGLYFLIKSPYMSRTDHLLMVEIPYMGRTGPIFPEKVLIHEPSAGPILEKVLIYEPSVSTFLERVLIYIYRYLSQYISGSKCLI